MTILSHLESAEESIRQALINSLAEKQDTNLSDLFHALNTVKSVIKSLPIRSTDNTNNYKYKLTSEYLHNGYVNYNFSEIHESPYDNVISFTGSSSPDKISLGLD